MKTIILAVQLLLATMGLYAQNAAVQLSDLPVIGISRSVSLHFLSPEKISYVDLSSNALVGDLPEKNLLRIKVVPDSASSLSSSGDAGMVTIVGETFISQFRLCFLPPSKTMFISSQVDIYPQQMRPLDISGVNLSLNQLKQTALELLSKSDKAVIEKVSAFGVSMTVNRIATAGDYVLLDLGFKNGTNLAFDVDELRFKIEDRKINKATNVQSVELKPVLQLYPFERFRKSFRNIYAIKKATFPGHRVLNIELSEKQLSGRNLKLSLKYADILSAETF